MSSSEMGGMSSALSAPRIRRIGGLSTCRWISLPLCLIERRKILSISSGLPPSNVDFVHSEMRTMERFVENKESDRYQDTRIREERVGGEWLEIEGGGGRRVDCETVTFGTIASPPGRALFDWGRADDRLSYLRAQSA